MADEQTVLDLVGSIYDAALTPELWPDVLDDLGNLMGCSRALIMTLDVLNPGSEMEFLDTLRLDPTCLVDYAVHYAATDIWAQRGMRLPIGEAALGEAIVPTAVFKRSEFYNDFLSRVEIAHALTSVIERDRELLTYISFYRTPRDGMFDEQSRSLLTTLAPHFRRAIRLHQKTTTLGLRGEGAIEVLDRLPMGVMLLDSHGKVVEINAAAERLTASGDGLQIFRGELTAANAKETHRLREVIVDAVAIGVGGISPAEGTMRVSRPSMKRAYEILVAPLNSVRDSPHFNLGQHRPCAVVFVNDPESQHETPAEVLTRLHGLTPAEARLAAALVAGQSLADFATEAEITANTARWTLKQVFAKTDTHRQAELVRRLLTGPAVLAD